MAKSRKMKKTFISLGLLTALLCINSFSAYAGTEREFWDMTIRSLKQESVLTTRNKETDLQYSWVKVDSMKSIGKVATKFVGPTWTITDPKVIEVGVNTGTWQCLPYITSGSYMGSPIALSAYNYNLSTSTGTIGGWVDYE